MTFDGQEQAMGTIRADTDRMVNTWTGHVWRVRKKAGGVGGGELIWQGAVADAAEAGKERGVELSTAWCGTQAVRAPPPPIPRAWKSRAVVPATLALGSVCDALLADSFKSRGFHVLCPVAAASVASSLPASVEAAALHRALAVFRDARRGAATPLLLLPRALVRLAELDALVRHGLDLGAAPSGRRAAGFFTAEGLRVRTLRGALRILVDQAQPLCLLEGGQWLWPAPAVGATRLVQLGGDAPPARLRTLSRAPRAFEVLDFVTPAEVAHIVAAARPAMAKSGVAHKEGDEGKAATTWRTSSTHFLSSSRDAVLEGLEQRIQRLVRVATTHFEDLQVLQYRPGERYLAHHDFFDPSAYAKTSFSHLVRGGANRLLTAFLYLSNVTEGGATVFPRAERAPVHVPAKATGADGSGSAVDVEGTAAAPMKQWGGGSFADCASGLAVQPRAGKLLLFYSLLPSGKPDDASLHGGCPPGAADEKWAANMWVWSDPFSGRMVNQPQAVHHYSSAEAFETFERAANGEEDEDEDDDNDDDDEEDEL